MDQKAFDAIRDRASELESKTTFGGDTFVAGAAELGTYLKDPKALSAAMGTLANYAAGMGGPSVDQSQMVEYATQLGKALDGTYDGLKKKGFELTEAQQKIIETGTDMEKVAVINDVINQSWKGLAESYANTPTGKIEQFKNKIGQLYEAAGQKLVGGVMRLLTAVTNLLDTLQNTGALDGVCVVLNVIMGLLGLCGDRRVLDRPGGRRQLAHRVRYPDGNRDRSSSGHDLPPVGYRGACPGPGRGLGACKCAAYYDDRPGRPSDLRRNGRRRHH